MKIRPSDPNARLLLAAVEKLAPLLNRIAFVGGCTTGLLITDPGSAPVRATLDVDAIIQVPTYATPSEVEAATALSYQEYFALEQQLQELGFYQPTDASVPRCRWVSGEVVLDLMPTDPAILGFTNRWYGPALDNAEAVSIGEHTIRLITSPYFLATKLEAFRNRGQEDYRGSRDLEDIITVIDGRAEVVKEVDSAAIELKNYLTEEFRLLSSTPTFLDALPGHLLPDAASQRRLPLILGRIQQMMLREV